MNVGLREEALLSQSNIFLLRLNFEMLPITGCHSRHSQMKFKGFLCHVSFLWVDGMALFPFILFNKKSPGKVLLNHECIHLRQQLEMGLVLFYIWYLAEYIVRLIQYRTHYLAYMHISFEQEAYRNESDFDYLIKRKFWAFLKHV